MGVISSLPFHDFVRKQHIQWRRLQKTQDWPPRFAADLGTQKQRGDAASAASPLGKSSIVQELGASAAACHEAHSTEAQQHKRAWFWNHPKTHRKVA